MRVTFIDMPLDETVSRWWASIDVVGRRAFLAVIGINILAFGFEMTNLTLHHDDVIHIFIQSTILGHYLGRFGFGWLHYYVQNHHVMPFLQMAQGMVAMSVYGVLVSHFWGLRKTTDLVLSAAIMCAFPYMAQIYQYNTSMATFSIAHLLAASCVILATRAKPIYVTIAALFFVAALSIYQAVAANAATIFIVWLLARHLFGQEHERLASGRTVSAVLAVIVAVVLGGAAYLLIVSTMGLAPDTIHSSDEAFHLGGALDWSRAIPEILRGTRAFYFWPEPYFPDYLKVLQLGMLGGAALCCLWLPRGMPSKLLALGLLALGGMAPRALQFLHPRGIYHSLTLTAYAVVVAGAVMVLHRSRANSVRNLSIVVTSVLIGGYVIQDNWISTVNYLNTTAHVSTLTQMLARVRAVPEANWDGRKIVVVGKYEMAQEYPFRLATGVATSYLDANHMQWLARLLRDDADFVEADATMPRVLAFAAGRPAWPDPRSVGVVDGMGVVILSKGK